MSRVLPPPESFEAQVALVIVGAGAAGLCAALAAKEAGADPILIERDAVPAGSTALSAGLIPAAGTRFQRAKGIADSPVLFADDIQRKAHHENDTALVEVVARESGPTVEWLAETYGLPFDVIDHFTYPGHSAMRMHGLPTRSGAELIDRLRSAAEAADVTILTESRVETLFADEQCRIRGVELTRADGGRERVGCDAVVLACNGYGGNAALVRELIPEMADALYFGHPGNQGEAVLWGRALAAQLAHLSAYQGHGSVATPHNILITWAVVAEGGFQVNAQGRRFSDETHGYSEQAAEVLRQPGEIAWDVFDARIAEIARQFEDFRAAEKGGALITADTLAELAARMRVPFASFAADCKEVEALKARGGADRFGRVFKPAQVLTPPYHAVKVTGALFHTQGGLAVDAQARVKRQDGGLFPNLFAAGGAAAGVSGETAAGYLSGNGLLTATVLGRLAGKAAAALA
ncbi:FAD-dependent oxidoreductase [Pseudolabrys taiwanensis]|uniref:FAD-dependent oxidoreductase n=1 Tax=Pseudolabrys taiwanensis TaxID=331696 RepID=A0A345ZVE6_9HYPH|nr:FAD-dependent oxidoreductase [Pseudolabrys taiwanensis]AXK80893.1 FAD-dependent oxidoreductase [Pseudolabrys taiwanensis]